MNVYLHHSLYGFSNIYVLGSANSNDAIIVDPAEMSVHLLNYIESNNYSVRAVLVTHNHTHHVHGLKTLLKIYDAIVYASSTRIEGVPTRVIHDGDSLEIAGIRLTALSVPGHSSDSIAYLANGAVFTGDVISAGLVGDTLSSHGRSLLVESIRKKIFTLPDQTVILPAHGPPSTVGAEKLYNYGLDPEYAKARGSRYDMFV